jgi:hypothetical protein
VYSLLIYFLKLHPRVAQTLVFLPELNFVSLNIVKINVIEDGDVITFRSQNRTERD